MKRRIRVSVLTALLILAALAPARLIAAIQYAGGTNINTTFVGTTRTLVADGVKTAIEAAGWTVVSGASGDWIMQSALTPQNLQVRVRLYDPGSGNCARVSFRNVAGTKVGNDLWLLPAALKTFRVIANRYSFWVIVPGSVTTRDFVAGGTIALPTFLNGVITEAFWSVANSLSDSDVAVRVTFRTALYTSYGMMGMLLNANLWNTSLGDNPGILQLVGQHGAHAFTNTAYTWHGGNFFLYDAIVSWGLTSAYDTGVVRGYLYDVAVTSAVLSVDSTAIFDGHNWLSMQGSAGGTQVAAGTILVVVP